MQGAGLESSISYVEGCGADLANLGDDRLLMVLRMLVRLELGVQAVGDMHDPYLQRLGRLLKSRRDSLQQVSGLGSVCSRRSKRARSSREIEAH